MLDSHCGKGKKSKTISIISDAKIPEQDVSFFLSEYNSEPAAASTDSEPQV